MILESAINKAEIYLTEQAEIREKAAAALDAAHLAAWKKYKTELETLVYKSLSVKQSTPESGAIVVSWEACKFRKELQAEGFILRTKSVHTIDHNRWSEIHGDYYDTVTTYTLYWGNQIPSEVEE